MDRGKVILLGSRKKNLEGKNRTNLCMPIKKKSKQNNKNKTKQNRKQKTNKQTKIQVETSSYFSLAKASCRVTLNFWMGHDDHM